MMACSSGSCALAGDVEDGACADAPQGALERPGVVRMSAPHRACGAHDEDRRRVLEGDVVGRQPFAARELLVEQAQEAALLGELARHHLAVSHKMLAQVAVIGGRDEARQLVDGESHLAAEVDEAGHAGLADGVVAVPCVRVDDRGGEQAALVQPAEQPRREIGQLGEAPDGDEVLLHGRRVRVGVP